MQAGERKCKNWAHWRCSKCPVLLFLYRCMRTCVCVCAVLFEKLVLPSHSSVGRKGFKWNSMQISDKKIWIFFEKFYWATWVAGSKKKWSRPNNRKIIFTAHMDKSKHVFYASSIDKSKHVFSCFFFQKNIHHKCCRQIYTCFSDFFNIIFFS